MRHARILARPVSPPATPFQRPSKRARDGALLRYYIITSPLTEPGGVAARGSVRKMLNLDLEEELWDVIRMASE